MTPPPTAVVCWVEIDNEECVVAPKTSEAHTPIRGYYRVLLHSSIFNVRFRCTLDFSSLL